MACSIAVSKSADKVVGGKEMKVTLNASKKEVVVRREKSFPGP